MTIGRMHRWSMVAMISLGPLGVLSGSTLLLVVGTLLITLTVLESARFHDETRSSLRRWSTHGLTVFGLLLSAYMFETIQFDAALIALMLGLFNRVMLRNGHRDDLILIGTSATLLAAATTVTPGVEYALLVLVLAPVSIAALWSASLIGTTEGGNEGARRSVFERASPRGLGRWTAAALGMTLAGSLLFAVFPRYKFTRWLGAGALIRLPGASDSMTLDVGGVGDSEDDTVVLRVYPESDLTPDQLAGLYARMYSLDHFDGRSWSAKTGNRGSLALDRRPHAPRERLRVVMERISGEPMHPVATFGRDRPAWSDHPAIRERLGGGWVLDRMVDNRFEYPFDLGWPGPEPTGMREIWETRREEGARQTPNDLDPRVVALARRLTETASTTETRVEAILGHFGSGYEYSLDPLPGTSSDPLGRFLFEAKRGHCELYAGAVATLLRLAGERARVATGYYGGHWNAVGGYLAFVQGDAHAWTEVWVDGEGWRWIDATPETERARRAQTSLWASIRDIYDGLSALWFERVVDFDAKRQRKLYAALADRFDASFGGAGDEGWRKSTRAAARRSAPIAGGVIAGLALLLPIAVWSRRRLGSAGRFGQQLRRRLGAKDADNSTLGSLLERSPDAVRSEAVAAVRAYEAFRFGPRAGDPELEHAVVRTLRALRRAQRQNRST